MINIIQTKSYQLLNLTFLLFLAFCVIFVSPINAENSSDGISKPLQLGTIVKFVQEAENHRYTATTDTGYKVRVVFYRPDVFRILAAFEGKFDDPLSKPGKASIVINDNCDVPNMTVIETGESVEFISGALTLCMQKSNCRFELFDHDNKSIFKELEPISIGENTVQTLSTGLEEYYYGGGQQNGYFSHKGRNIDIKADGNWDEGGHPNPAPFYMSSNGYGVLRNTFSPGKYDFSSNLAIKLEHKEQRFDAYYFIGHSYNRIVDLYTQFTGRPNFVPIWALELGEADAFMTRDKVTKEPLKDENGEFVEITPDCIDRVAEQYRKHDMPGGWLLVNDGYGCGYVELPRVVSSLADLGFYTGLWTEKGLEKTKWEVGTAGTRLQKLDVAWTGPAYQFSLDANKQAWESLVSNSDSRGFVWTVQGWAGTQRYSVCWTGDQYGSWDLIRYHIPTLIGSGMSGQAYATTDVDGIFGGSSETYTRDLQWKCFTPVLYAMNGWSNINKSPWSYDEPYRSINRKYLKMKMRMMPYMYKYTKEAYDTGAPIVRGMIWDNPTDKHTWGPATQYQYMLGEWILVAPVYTSMNINKGWRKEDIYLPEGCWVDYWDGRKLEGPKTIGAYPITLEKLPLIIKAGAIIPMYPEMLYNNQKPKDPLTFDIYPYGKSEFEMYEDDGLTRKYQQGEFSRQLITVNAPEGKAGDIDIQIGKCIGNFDGKLSSRVYELEIHSELKPISITMEDKTILELTEPDAYPNALSGWYYDANDRRGIIHIKLLRLPTDTAVELHIDIDENQHIPVSEDYPVPAETDELDRSEFKVSTNSQQGISINSAFDGTPETIWHSNYSKNPGENVTEHPFIVDIDLNGLYAVNGFQYMARENLGNGTIKDFEIYVSRIKDNFGKPVYIGQFEKINGMQTVNFPAVWGEYVRIKILSEVRGRSYASAAEFNVLRDTDAPPLEEQVVYLSDIQPASAKGEYRYDRSIGGKAIIVNDNQYEKGIGTRADSEIIYNIDGSFDRLAGYVGMDDEVAEKGSVMFRVFADNNLVFESPEMTGDNIKQLMELNIKGVKELRLELMGLDDGTLDDHGDWVDVKLIRNGSE